MFLLECLLLSSGERDMEIPATLARLHGRAVAENAATKHGAVRGGGQEEAASCGLRSRKWVSWRFPCGTGGEKPYGEGGWPYGALHNPPQQRARNSRVGKSSAVQPWEGAFLPATRTDRMTFIILPQDLVFG